jgi:hypothetical protein
MDLHWDLEVSIWRLSGTKNEIKYEKVRKTKGYETSSDPFAFRPFSP